MPTLGVRAAAGVSGSPPVGVAAGVAGGLAVCSAGGPSVAAASLGVLSISCSGDTKEEGLFSPCNHSHNGAVRRGGFGTMKTILLPLEEQPSVEPTIDTAVLLAAVFGSYVEGFALTPDPPLLEIGRAHV